MITVETWLFDLEGFEVISVLNKNVIANTCDAASLSLLRPGPIAASTTLTEMLMEVMQSKG
jgi:hypothetical protein